MNLLVTKFQVLSVLISISHIAMGMAMKMQSSCTEEVRLIGNTSHAYFQRAEVCKNNKWKVNCNNPVPLCENLLMEIGSGCRKACVPSESDPSRGVLGVMFDINNTPSPTPCNTVVTTVTDTQTATVTATVTDIPATVTDITATVTYYIQTTTVTAIVTDAPVTVTDTVTNIPATVTDIQTTTVTAIVTDAPATVTDTVTNIPDTVTAIVTAAPVTVTDTVTNIPATVTAIVTNAPATVTDAPVTITDAAATVTNIQTATVTAIVTNAPATVTDAPVTITDAPATVTTTVTANTAIVKDTQTTTVTVAATDMKKTTVRVGTDGAVRETATCNCAGLAGGLGALTILMAIILVGVVMGWVCSCYRRIGEKSIIQQRDPTTTPNDSYITQHPLVQYSSLGPQDTPTSISPDPTYDIIGVETPSKEERIYQVLEQPTGEDERGKERDYYEEPEEDEEQEYEEVPVLIKAATFSQ